MRAFPAFDVAGLRSPVTALRIVYAPKNFALVVPRDQEHLWPPGVISEEKIVKILPLLKSTKGHVLRVPFQFQDGSYAKIAML
jgi:hypothetical protein